MITPSQRIHDLVQKGALPPEQAETLLAALRTEQPGWSRLLLDPFVRFGGERLALVGLGVALLGSLLRPLGVAFDGFLDTHYTDRHGWVLAVAEAVVAWPLGALVLWLLSLAFARQGRFIDFLGVVGVARIPVVACGLALAIIARVSPLPAFTPDQPPELGANMIALALVGCVGLAWFIVLLYRGFGTASGLRGGKRVIAFVLGLLIAEIASKLGLAAIGQMLPAP